MNKSLTKIIFNAVGLGMGVATLVLSILNKIPGENAIKLLSIGLISLAIARLNDK